MTIKETIIEDVVGSDYASSSNYFVNRGFEKWFFKQFPEFKRGDVVKFKVNVEVLNDR